MYSLRDSIIQNHLELIIRLCDGNLGSIRFEFSALKLEQIQDLIDRKICSSEQLTTEQLTREQSVMTTDFGYIGVPRDVRKELDGLGNLGLKRR